MSHFQVMLDGKWTTYEKTEDGILKRAYMSGHKKAKYNLRGSRYEYDFIRMKQRNLESAKERDIRPPYKMKPPSKPLIPSGPTMIVKVPPRSSGTLIQVPHPSDKSQMICVQVPRKARAGQAMIVPIPSLSRRPVGHVPTPTSGRISIPAPSAPPASSGYAPQAPVASDSSAAILGKKSCGKDVVGVGLAGAGLVGGCAVAGALIGDAVAESGGMDDIIDTAEVAFEDAGDWLLDVGEDAGDFIMDLF